MEINSELCHVDDNRIIVKATVSEKQVLLSSALGQGKDVNEAEKNALENALTRINLSISKNKANNTTSSIKMNNSNIHEEINTKNNPLEIKLPKEIKNFKMLSKTPSNSINHQFENNTLKKNFFRNFSSKINQYF